MKCMKWMQVKLRKYQSKVTIPVGTRGYITNGVKEHSHNYVFLQLSRTQTDNTICKGKWSADSTGSGTVFN